MSLLLLFNSPTNDEINPPELPDLHIKDAKTGENVPVSGLSGYDGDYIQTVAVQFSPLEFTQVATNLSSATETGEIWTRRKRFIVIRILFSDSNASLSLRLLRKDKNGRLSCSSVVSINATSIQDAESGKYLGEEKVLESYGADKVKLYVESISAGEVDIWLGAV